MRGKFVFVPDVKLYIRAVTYGPFRTNVVQRTICERLCRDSLLALFSDPFPSPIEALVDRPVGA